MDLKNEVPSLNMSESKAKAQELTMGNLNGQPVLQACLSPIYKAPYPQIMSPAHSSSPPYHPLPLFVLALYCLPSIALTSSSVSSPYS